MPDTEEDPVDYDATIEFDELTLNGVDDARRALSFYAVAAHAQGVAASDIPLSVAEDYHEKLDYLYRGLSHYLVALRKWDPEVVFDIDKLGDHVKEAVETMSLDRNKKIKLRSLIMEHHRDMRDFLLEHLEECRRNGDEWTNHELIGDGTDDIDD